MDNEKLFGEVCEKLTDRILALHSLDAKINLNKALFECTLEVLKEHKLLKE